MYFQLFGMLFPAQSQRPLFTIARSTNANLVQYDARLTSSNVLDPKNPVVAYWIMAAEDGRHVELSAIERKTAYGFKLATDVSTGCYRMTLAAEKKREINVCLNGETARAEMMIGGHAANLYRMFISTKRIGLWRGVNYIELFGTDIKSGEPCYEKIIPD